MSATLFFFIPIGMMAVVWSLCFVGCVLPVSGLPDPYSNQILGTTGIVAYWPLGDAPGETVPPGAPPLPAPPQNSQSLGVAGDLTGNNHNGSFTVPPAYPAGTTIPQIASPTPMTGLVLRQSSIVKGDVSKSGSIDKNIMPGCVDFEGGYVSIPWAANSPDLTDFTLEAWVKPKWNVTGFNWVVFDAQTAKTGFGLYIDASNQWVLSVGDGSTIQTISTMVPAAVGGALTYVAVTFDKGTKVLSLWINPQIQSDLPNPPPPPPAWPPTPDQTTTYVPVDSTQMTTFFIGAGATQLPLRINDGDANTAPLFPFQGQIQDVALYDVALSGSDLADHFSNGSSAT